jgi:hypothetical protein
MLSENSVSASSEPIDYKKANGSRLSANEHNLDVRSDAFFLGNELFGIKLNSTTKENTWVIFRVKDCSKMCVFDACHSTFVYSEYYDPDYELRKVPPQVSGIIDFESCKIYPPNINTLIHLGVKELNLFRDDTKIIQAFEDTTYHPDSWYQVLGLPAPALLPFALKKHLNKEDLSLKSLESLQKYTIAEWATKKSVK